MRTTSGLRALRCATWCAAALPIAVLAALPVPATAQEDRSGLTRASFRRNCLLCHNKAAPEGVSPEILAGLHPVPGLKPRDALPGIVCLRRCEVCKLPERPGAP